MHLDASVTANLLSGFCIAVIGLSGTIGGVFIGKLLEKNHKIEYELRQPKIKVYEKFLDFIYTEVLVSTKNNKTVSEKKLQDFGVEFSKDLTLWGSDEVVKHWLGFKSNADVNPLKMWIHIDGMLRSIRKDVGHRNHGINQFKMLGMMIKDVKNLKRITKEQQHKMHKTMLDNATSKT